MWCGQWWDGRGVVSGAMAGVWCGQWWDGRGEVRSVVGW